MNNASKLLAASATLLLAACGSDSHDGTPAVEVTELAAGVHQVSTGDVTEPVDGKYYAAADGSRLLVLNASDQRASGLYQRDAGGDWRASPAPEADLSVSLSGSSAMQQVALNAASVAGRYAVRLASGDTAAMSVTAGGDIVPGSTGCRLAGKVSATPLPNALRLTLTTSGCGDLPVRGDGYLVVDADYAPAAFRLLVAGSRTPVDLWAYAE